MKTIHILGMAKSPLVLKPGQARSLELDFFKLAFAVTHLRATGHDAFGYLQVIAAPPRKRIEGWIQKYDLEDSIEVLHYEPTSAEQKRLRQEKLANKAGLAGKAVPLKNGKKASDSSYGKKLAERALRCALGALHPEIPELKKHPKHKQPAQTDWDYYGTSPTEI